MTFMSKKEMTMIFTKTMMIFAKELLPKIKRLYDTGLVDEMCCGDYNEVEKEILQK